MILIVDANRLFAALIKKGITAALFLEEDLDIYSPQFIFEEFDKYKEEILAKTKRPSDQFDQYVEFLKRRIIIIPKDYFVDFLMEARTISPDPDDVPYFALALNLGGSLWSNDNVLKEDQTIIQVFTTKELADLYFPDNTYQK